MSERQPTPEPTNLSERVLWLLGRMPVSDEADPETRESIRDLRRKFGMNPDLTQRGA